MGTITFHKSEGMSAIDCLKRELHESSKNVIAWASTWEAVFAAYRRHDPESTTHVPDAEGYIVALLVFKISRGRGYQNFGYKDMDECCGPCGLEAPLSIIAKCSPLREVTAETPADSSLRWAHDYRLRCRQVAEAKKRKRALKAGQVVTLPNEVTFRDGFSGREFFVDRLKVQGRKGISTVFRSTGNGRLYSLTTRNLEGAVVRDLGRP